MTADLLDLSSSKLLAKFGAGNHKPGSGSAAAFQGLLAAQLLQTVISLTLEPRRAHIYADQLPKLRQMELALRDRIIPELERLFHADSVEFDKVIHLRRQRESEVDPIVRKQLADKAILALIPAIEIPIHIAKACLELATYALDVFDHGFQSALGDSGVALSAAISGASGCLFIVELNLQQVEAGDWADRVIESRDALTAELRELNKAARNRHAAQTSLTKRKMLLSAETKSIAVAAKGKGALSEATIESLVVRLQIALWKNRDLLWKRNIPSRAIDVLDPVKALECFGIAVHNETTLGEFVNKGMTYEIAGQINQSAKVVSVSEQFPQSTRRFTTAHELGHHLLHNQLVLHRDRPLDGFRSFEPRDSEEWQADKFASYFLMPRKLVKKIFADLFLTEQFRINEVTAFALNERSSRELQLKCRDLRGLSRLLATTTSYNGTHFYSMSEQFKVSVETMAIRLEELELLLF